MLKFLGRDFYSYPLVNFDNHVHICETFFVFIISLLIPRGVLNHSQ